LYFIFSKCLFCNSKISQNTPLVKKTIRFPPSPMISLARVNLRLPHRSNRLLLLDAVIWYQLDEWRPPTRFPVRPWRSAVSGAHPAYRCQFVLLFLAISVAIWELRVHCYIRGSSCSDPIYLPVKLRIFLQMWIVVVFQCNIV
jgi:hypothetical protein